MHSVLWPILRQVIRHPRRTAVVDDQRTWRYMDLAGGAFYLAKRIERVSSAPRVGIMLPTSGAFPLAAMATWLLGRTAVPINYLLSEPERQYIADHAELDAVVTARPMLEAVGDPPEGVEVIELDRLRFTGAPPLRFPPIPRAGDVAVVLYTSGTSGTPKGVMLTHRNLSSNVKGAVKLVGLKKSDGFLGVLPQFHSFGLTGLTLAPLHLGAKVVYTARFVPRRLVDLIREHRPDVLMAIPSMYGALAAVKRADADDMSSLRLPISGGEPLPRRTADAFESKFNVMIREGYGLTETSPIISINTHNRYRRGSVGLPISGCKVRILDENGRPREHPNEEGEVAVAGPNIMAGYLKQPDLTADVIDADGYFHTGDMGRLDEDGFLYITGRKKEMLIIGGENVYPAEIEEVLNEHPAVHVSAVVGRQDPVRGEQPIAFVELEEDAQLDEAELRSFCAKKLARYKVPREVRAVEQLPRSSIGKILRRKLTPVE